MVGDPLSAETLPAMFLRAVGSHRGTALEHKDDAGSWHKIAYPTLGRNAVDVARGLVGAGVKPGDRVAIFAGTRPEWVYADYGALCAGAIVVPVYHTSSSEEVRHVLEHSGASVAIVEAGAPTERLSRVRAHCPQLREVFSLDGDDLDELLDRGASVDQSEIQLRAAAVSPDDVSTLVYTSGTTGAPKGCMLTHANYRANTRMCANAIDLGNGARIFVFLPFAHSMTRCTGQLAIENGHTLVFYGGDLKKVLDELAQTRPTHLPSVPRIFENVHAAALGRIGGSGLRKRVFEWALETGARERHDAATGRRRTPVRAMSHRLADRLVLRKVRDLFGGNLRLALTGAAPIDPDILRFFDACGILILEGYGMTEASAAAAANTPLSTRFGTVGRALPPGEIEIASDGEILMRGPHIFAGYYRDEAATNDVLVDEWLHSGDLGNLDDNGYLRITGRKKDILITSSGKNVTPGVLENALRQSRLISHAIIVGDRRPYLVALLDLDREETEEMSDEEIRSALGRDIQQANRRFARIEQVKRFAVLPRPLTPEHGELTSTMKVKRAAVISNWHSLVEDLYAERRGEIPSAVDNDAPVEPALEAAHPAK